MKNTVTVREDMIIAGQSKTDGNLLLMISLPYATERKSPSQRKWKKSKRI